MKRVTSLIVVCALLLLPALALADAPVLPRPGGIFDRPTELLQQAVDFVLGPYVLGTGMLLLVACIVGWNFSPKEGIVAPLMRWGGSIIGMIFAGAFVLEIAAF